jgi:MinD-like ATPase involved in chromosome partitioning or flagellar assembly
MSSIVTFYSYKGGVGRSMALANIAVLLAQRGLKVLVVDWDLEAPGLERYFSYFEIKQTGPGLLRMCMQVRDKGKADYKKFTSTIVCKTPHPITLLSSGRETDESYTTNLEEFDWDAFFRKRGGAFIEQLRERWKKDFDVTLIDSRTGLSDTGGICTIQLPDIVVGMFTANLQSLYGVRDVMRLAQQARQRLAYDRMPLSVFPLPARWGVQEFQETQVWLDRIADATKEFYEDWLPKGILSRDVIEAVKIPQIAFFGFGERLAVVEQGTSDPQGMGFAYAKVASFIASDFKEVDALIGEQKVLAAEATAAVASKKRATEAEATEDYLYDVFFSYDMTMSELVLEFTDRVKRELTLLRGDPPPKTFIDVQEISVGEAWADKLSEALIHSKVLVAFVTPRYVRGSFASKEFKLFSERSGETGKALLIPVILRGEHFPDYVNEIQWLDLRKTSWVSSAQRLIEFSHQARLLAERLDKMIAQAPKFDSNWGKLAKGFYETAE